MKKLGLNRVTVILCGINILVLTIMFLVLLFTDYCYWPRKYCCPICNKSIWAWQDYERRFYPVRIRNRENLPQDVMFVITGSMNFHKHCPGIPEDVSVDIIVDQSDPEQFIIKKDVMRAGEQVDIKVIRLRNRRDTTITALFMKRGSWRVKQKKHFQLSLFPKREIKIVKIKWSETGPLFS